MCQPFVSVTTLYLIDRLAALMVEVRTGLLLGNEKDAAAVACGKRLLRSKRKPRVTITHILSITNHPPDWSEPAPAAPPTCTGQHHEAGGGGERGGEEEVEGEGNKPPTRLLATKFVEAADLPGTDLLHRFDECCHFIQEGVELGAVLVHWSVPHMTCHMTSVCHMVSAWLDSVHHMICHMTCHMTAVLLCVMFSVYGISRSATIVLAYLMWREGRPLHLLYTQLQAKKTDIRLRPAYTPSFHSAIPPSPPPLRPNPGFMEQLELWGVMRCRLDTNNKRYKAYRLKHLANTLGLGARPGHAHSGHAPILHASHVEKVKSAMAADPGTRPLNSTAYYRCRKCR